MSVFEQLTKGYQIPNMVKIRQNFARPILKDIPGAIKTELYREGILERVKSGDRVAITAGSRGIANIAAITREVVAALKEVGARPFIIPAMGSHGGATADGQVEVLHSFGITEESVGAPIKSSMEILQVGTTENNLPVCIDKIAYTEADAIVLINRIKPHTTFRGAYESGLAKMIVIGLGKQIGAELCHATGVAQMSPRIEELARHTIEKANIVFGVGILENAYDETSRIVAIPGGRIMAEEPALLAEAFQNMPQILFDKYDVLVIDEVGKNISGTGMDPNIVGRFTTDAIKCEPRVQRIVVLRLTEETHGNANGIGLADICSRRAFEQMDFKKTYPNCLTSRIVQSVKIPMVMDNDRQAIRAAIKTCFDVDPKQVRIIRIKNTLQLDEIYISESLLPLALQNPKIEVLDEAKPLVFDREGNL